LGKFRKILLITVFFSLVSFNKGAQEDKIAFADKLVPTNVRLTNDDVTGFDNNRIDRVVYSFLRKWSIAGASVAIAKDGKLVFARGFGYIDTALKIQTQPYNKFRIASISKLVTATAIMKLSEEGKLSLDDKVFGPEGILNDKYFSNPKDKRAYDITVEQLLSHEGGWTQRYGDQMFMPITIADKMGLKPPVSTKDIVRFALDRRLQYTPGKGRSYSNLGYSILGLVIEKITGMSYENYCQEYILHPLGIYDMSIAGNMPWQRAVNETMYYEPADVLPKPSIYGTGEMLPPSYGGNDITALGAAGAWIATAPDLMRLCLSVDGFNTRPDILSDTSIKFMTDRSYGFAPVGWKGTIYNGNWWRTGSFPGTAGMMKRQSNGISWVVLLNSSAWNGPEIYSYISNMMYRVMLRIKTWPENDLFNYSLPVPLKYSLSETSHD